jgi:sugar phosphate permease
MSAETGGPLPPSILPGAHADAHRYWRRRILWAATVTYAIYYLCRVNISIAIPFLQRSLGYSKTELGMVASSLQVPYGLGKFLNGLIADRTNPRYFMAAGLLLSGISNLAFSASAALPILALVWALNGWFQSMGFPSGARLLSHYYEPEEYGRSWSIFGCSHQVGACIILVAGGYLGIAGWQNIFRLPGLVAIVAAAGTVAVLQDVPHRNEALSNYVSQSPPVSVSLGAGLSRILTSYRIWSVAVGNLFLYVVRYGLLTWMATFFISEKRLSSIEAGWSLGAFEVSGIFGMLSAGWVSDVVFGGRRALIMAAYMAALALPVMSLLRAPAGNALWMALTMSACGFCVYGPLMLVSVAAAQHAGKELAASASGFAGLFGYVGATVAGIGIGALADHAGWTSVFFLLAAMSLMSALCFALSSGAAVLRRVKYQSMET